MAQITILQQTTVIPYKNILMNRIKMKVPSHSMMLRARRPDVSERKKPFCNGVLLSSLKNIRMEHGQHSKTQRLNWEPVVTIVPLSRPTRWDLAYGKKSMQTASSAK